jgi:hypothetical protein
MVPKAQIEGYDVERVFMDVGSGINLIYARTLKAMNISLEWLQPTHYPFHGIVPGSTNHCDILAQGLIGLIGYSYQQGIPSFLEAHLKRTPG